jgi:hypothetical protein
VTAAARPVQWFSAGQAGRLALGRGAAGADWPVDLQAELVGKVQVEENNVCQPGGDVFQAFHGGVRHD